MDRGTQALLKQRSRSLSVKTRGESMRLLLDDIHFVELVGKTLCFHLKDGSFVTSTSQRISFTEAILPLLKDQRFAKDGASFVINLFYVKSIEKDAALFVDGRRLSLPKNACAALRTSWLDYWFEGGENN